MPQRKIVATVVSASLMLAGVMVSGGADAQSMPAARLQQQSGLPDWSGYWRTRATNRLLDPLQVGPAQPANPLWRSHPPYKAEVEAIYAARNVRSAEQGVARDGRKSILDSYTAYCMAGPFRSLSNGFQKQFVITPEKTLFLSGGEMRVFYTDGRRFPPDDQLPENAEGWSIGHWEGETLVVETRKIYSGHWFDGTPLFFSPQAIIHERFTRVDAQTISDEVTIDDPVNLMRPWKFTRVLGYLGKTEDPAVWPQNKENCFGAGNRMAVSAGGDIRQQVGGAAPR